MAKGQSTELNSANAWSDALLRRARIEGVVLGVVLGVAATVLLSVIG